MLYSSYFVIFYIRQFSTVENSLFFPAPVFILVMSVLWCRVWGIVSPVWTSSTWLLSSSPRAKIFVLHILLKVLFQSAHHHASLPLYTPEFLISLLQVWYLESSLIFEIWLLVSKNEHTEWILKTVWRNVWFNTELWSTGEGEATVGLAAWRRLPYLEGLGGFT